MSFVRRSDGVSAGARIPAYRSAESPEGGGAGDLVVLAAAASSGAAHREACRQAMAMPDEVAAARCLPIPGAWPRRWRAGAGGGAGAAMADRKRPALAEAAITSGGRSAADEAV